MTMPTRAPDLMISWFRSAMVFMLASCLMACAAVPDSATAQAKAKDVLSARVAAEDVLDVLFVGNSYSFKVPAAFAKEATARGRKVRVDQVTHGGWTLGQHAKSEQTLAAIRSGNWDVIVFQEQSRIPSQSAMRALLMVPSLRTLVAEARKAGAVPVLYQTWGYRDGDPKVAGDDFFAMNRRVREGYLASSNEIGGLPVIPAGDAWELEAKNGKLADLFVADGSHPSAKGNALTAKVFADALGRR
jgi:hypothetical protein